jgi:hypothetical protein
MYNYTDQVKEDEMGKERSTNGGVEEIAYKLLVRKTGEKRPLGRPGRMWVDSAKLDLGK